MAAVGELFRATWQLHAPSGLVEFVWHLRGNTGLETSAGLATNMNGFVATMAPVIPSDVTFTGCVAQQLTPYPLLTDFVASVGSGSAGVAANQTTSIIVTWRTILAGGRYRGRTYFLVPSNFQATSANTINGTGIPIFNTFCGNVLTHFADTGLTGWTMGVYSRAIGGGGPIYNTSGWSKVTGYSVQSVFGNQRRRRLGRGA